MSEWSHLPNAVHIDRILAHLEAHPGKWTAIWSAGWGVAWDAAGGVAWDTTRDEAWYAARGATRGATLFATWDAARPAARPAAWQAAWNAAAGAIIALIANDTCAYLLREKIEHVELLASLGIDEAILLLPAVKAMSHE
jgi:hypothetical protein